MSKVDVNVVGGAVPFSNLLILLSFLFLLIIINFLSSVLNKLKE